MLTVGWGHRKWINLWFDTFTTLYAMDAKKINKHRVYKEHIYDGMVMSGVFPASVLDRIKNIDLDHDVLIAAYPKTGTNSVAVVLVLKSLYQIRAPLRFGACFLCAIINIGLL